MEDELQRSPRPGYPADSPDVKYLSGLSTMLVATIQDVKDRISQIEYIFCSQLFPNFHLKTQSLQKIYFDAREAAEDAYKEKEKDFLHQIKMLQCEKLQFMEEKAVELNELKQEHENLLKVLDSKESLILRHENTIKEVEHKNFVILKKQSFLEAETEKLQLELLKKSEEVNEVMKVLNTLLKINQSSASARTGSHLKEYEEKANKFISELEIKRWKFDELQSGLREKNQEVENVKKLQENFLQKIEHQASEIKRNEQLVNKYVKENSLLTSKILSLVNCVDELKKELLKKNNDLEEEKKVHKQLLLQIDSFSFESAKRGTELEGFENQRRLLVDKQKVSEETIGYLQQIIPEKSKEPSVEMELHGKLLQKFEAKDSELLSEKRKYQELTARYKKLKSQYNYVCKKFDLTPETMLSHKKIEDDSDTTSRDIQNKASKAVDAAIEETRPQEEQELLPDNGTLLIEKANPASSSTTRASVSPERPSGIKSYLPGGGKRPISYWRDTRSHQSRLGPDPHDDFLDTPLEKVKENRGNLTTEETRKCPKQDINDTKFSNSDNDDETQDMLVDPEPQRRPTSSSTRGTSGFKYVEPVRKKSDRESLKGVECKQCKKFYDAVLPCGEENADGNRKNIRCEHHNEVSRHRYRFAPPLTPEGFWNIGFDSEM
ncbi:protein gamma response 1 [Dorcoceras hygrometricum]|uniref:Protein gamma response 1 n=1 Tax=Dorcoceras hygrometricum TaxID=472368 RepID=A0A2Z7AC37_9LAMI|nr:protein gamma response 1 [Dorcoceras hygrometricum]